jgi:hypothetical protein
VQCAALRAKLEEAHTQLQDLQAQLSVWQVRGSLSPQYASLLLFGRLLTACCTPESIYQSILFYSIDMWIACAHPCMYDHRCAQEKTKLKHSNYVRLQEEMKDLTEAHSNQLERFAKEKVPPTRTPRHATCQPATPGVCLSRATRHSPRSYYYFHCYVCCCYYY